MAIQQGGEPFLLPGGPEGVLLVHGFTGSPSEMRLLGDYLHVQGYTVLAVRLSGHATAVEEMQHTTWQHWYDSVMDGYQLLCGICHTVTVAGLSMGGLLALALAAEYPVAGLVLMSTPIFIADKRLPFLPVYRLLHSYMPKKRHRYDTGGYTMVHYQATPLKSLSGMLAALAAVKKQLPAIEAPTFIAQSRIEHTVRPESAEYIYKQLGSSSKRLLWLEKSGHLITLDRERNMLFAAISKFLKEICHEQRQ